MHYKTIIVSDIHLGTKDAKSKELSIFLKNNSCEKLILNGDIIDAWSLKRNGQWRKRDTRVFRRILRMIEEQNTHVIYIRGNHDDFLINMLPFRIGSFEIMDSYEYTSGNIKFFITHGDIFDIISTNFRWIAKIGDIGYKLLLWINRRYNRYRRLRGLPYYSLSSKVKQKVKMAVSYIGDFEKVMVDYARTRGYSGVICGHIHSPSMKNIDGIEYYNSGDWVETMSALVEHPDHSWELTYFHKDR
jgi:UDP-2,3-diacylglucosamine pyrophosphatase LpxH